MSATLDRTERRIIGVLIEKELSVPDLYPLTEVALLAGCNQKNNREPVMELQEFEIQGALLSLRMKEWVSRSEREGGRAVRYRHEVDDRLGIEGREKAVLAELLLRGPQTPGELKSRVGRMGFEGSPDDVRAVLEGLAAKPGGALVELLPKAPRERDARWRHLLSSEDETAEAADLRTTVPAPREEVAVPPVPQVSQDSDEELSSRVAKLEELLEVLQGELQRIETQLKEIVDDPGGERA